MNSGWMMASWASRYSRQAAASTGSGVRLPGGRHLRMFRMYTSWRRSFMPLTMMLVRSWPARPTNGSPWRSSSAPGASPNEDQPGVGIAHAEDRLRAGAGQLGAAGAGGHLAGDLGQGRRPRIGRRRSWAAAGSRQPRSRQRSPPRAVARAGAERGCRHLAEVRYPGPLKTFQPLHDRRRAGVRPRICTRCASSYGQYRGRGPCQSSQCAGGSLNRSSADLARIAGLNSRLHASVCRPDATSCCHARNR